MRWPEQLTSSSDGAVPTFFSPFQVAMVKDLQPTSKRGRSRHVPSDRAKLPAAWNPSGRWGPYDWDKAVVVYGHQVDITPDSAKNFAVPSAMTAGGLTSSPSFDTALNLTQNSGPNGATSTFDWDGMKRQTSQTSPSGQVINLDSAVTAPPEG